MMVRIAVRVAVAALIAGLAWWSVPLRANAVEVSVTELLEKPELFDAPGMEVTLVGELVGDYGTRRTGWMWTQLNDDSYARDPLVDGGPKTGSNIGVGIRMPLALAADLDPPGGYRLRGPIVRVTGTWKYHDPDRQGESYLEVAGLEVVDGGRRIEEGPDTPVLVAGLALMLVAAGLWWRRPRPEA